VKPKPLGRKGEDLAASYLRDLGWEIVERNYTTWLGEIDLVCRDHGTLVFVEVKTRTETDFARPDQSVTQHKQAKLRRLVEEYLVKHGQESADVRCDVLGVTLKGRRPEFDHIVGAL
jgi:putative endonuclease